MEGNSIDDENATEFWSLFKFSEPSHCPSLQLSVDPKVDQVCLSCFIGIIGNN